MTILTVSRATSCVMSRKTIIRYLAVLAALLLVGCADVNWRETGARWLEDVCEKERNCDRPGDDRNPYIDRPHSDQLMP